MKAKTLRILEYDKILAMLKKETGSAPAATMVDALRPGTDLGTIREDLQKTSEAARMIEAKGPLPVSGTVDIGEALKMAKMGGSLSMRELLDVALDLRIARDVVRFLESEDVPSSPLIGDLAGLIQLFPHVEQEIGRCILSEDEMADTASPALRDIRRQIGKVNETVKNRLNQMVTTPTARTYLQDQIVTMRDGRYCIPVKQEYRAFFPGMLHDQSRGGATLFIEPQAVVELNNRRKELEAEEEREIARILYVLSSMVAEHYDLLRANQKILTELDFINAKGLFSRKIGGEAADVTEGGPLHLVAARHPLIEADRVVPIDIQVGGPCRTLIITGPNTGGKTVSLKTAGLLSLMALSGLHIPASFRSKVPVYREMYADIGDEQSIEQSLSTFSSHMKNLVALIGEADQDSLVLLDELGAGTDPTEGAALAVAILESLYDKGATVMATTHYNELKKYALSTPGVMNAAMEFDVETLSPTYKLLTGVPGKSNAFEISARLGLNPQIIERASTLLETGDIAFENVLSALERDREKAERDRDEQARLLEDIRKRSEALQVREQSLADTGEDILRKAREEAASYIREAKQESEEVKEDLRRLVRQEQRHISGDAVQAFADLRRKIRTAEEKLISPDKEPQVERASAQDPVQIGDRVKIRSLHQTGIVGSDPDEKGNILVRIGPIKVTIGRDDLLLVEKKKPERTAISRQARAGSAYGSLAWRKAETISPSCDVRGENLDSALMDVYKYLDDAYMAGLDKVSIIHGRGTGVLRTGIREALGRNKYVQSLAPAPYDQGGEGVTVVTLKK